MEFFWWVVLFQKVVNQHIRSFFQTKRGFLVKCLESVHWEKNILPRSLTVRPWRATISKGKDCLLTIHFSGASCLASGVYTLYTYVFNFLGCASPNRAWTCLYVSFFTCCIFQVQTLGFDLPKPRRETCWSKSSIITKRMDLVEMSLKIGVFWVKQVNSHIPHLQVTVKGLDLSYSPFLKIWDFGKNMR